MIGYEIERYRELQDESRKCAIARMVKQAEELDANAIVAK